MTAERRALVSVWDKTGLDDFARGLHELGFAHCVESWQEGHLVGGLYGMALGKAFFGESMFARAADASKVALVRLVERLRAQGCRVIDCQQATA